MNYCSDLICIITNNFIHLSNTAYHDTIEYMQYINMKYKNNIYKVNE